MLLLAYLGGLLTIMSPCILPIVPLVFSRADRSFVRDTVPMLVGLAVVFAIVASVATASAEWIIRASEIGRLGAIALLALVAISLLVPRFADLITGPLVRAGSKIDGHVSGTRTIVGSLLVGAAIGLLWAPCAGPILGIIIATAALKGSSSGSAILFAAFALGAATSLGLAMFAGSRVLGKMKRYAGADIWVRRSLGVLALAGVFVIVMGWDRTLFAKGGLIQTAGAEELLISRLAGTKAAVSAFDNGKSIEEFSKEEAAAPHLVDEGEAPGFGAGGPWINSSAIDLASLKGKVVMVDFWTFECYNCLNALPYVKALEAKYRSRGLVVIGVHTPEFPREKVEANVREQVKSLGIVYPVVMDNGYKVWNSFHNQYWPAVYFIDAKGRIRFHHFGEGAYDEQDRVVDKLLTEAGR